MNERHEQFSSVPISEIPSLPNKEESFDLDGLLKELEELKPPASHELERNAFQGIYNILESHARNAETEKQKADAADRLRLYITHYRKRFGIS